MIVVVVIIIGYLYVCILLIVVYARVMCIIVDSRVGKLNESNNCVFFAITWSLGFTRVNCTQVPNYVMI